MTTLNSFQDILVEIEPPVAIVTFNRPTVLNALRTSLLAEVSRALTEL
jgi:enoyl-CoA hydratase/carnithine racemase